MQLPGIASQVFLAYLCLFLPWAAFRSARYLANRGRNEPLPPVEAIWKGTLFAQVLLFVLAWVAGRQFGYRIFAMPAISRREIAATVLALGTLFLLRAIARAVRSPEERRQMTVYFLAARTTRQMVLQSITILVASIAEEAAYRGVGMSILHYSLGNPWLAALICCVVFALAHMTQGWKSAVVIFGVAAVMHGLVAYTHTLVLAMIIHAIFDFVAVYLIRLEALEFDRQENASADTAGASSSH